MPDIIQNYQVYPRGFLGKPMHELVGSRTTKQVASIKKFMFQIRVHDPGNDLQPSEAVCKFYEELHGRVYRLGKIDYQKKVFREALALFNSQSFIQWLYAQQSSPFYSSLHRDFLIDTVRFIVSGKRRMALENWASLITLSSNPYVHQTLPFSKEDEQLIKSNESTLLSFSKTIAQWLSQENGIEDFVQTLYVFFGDMKRT